MSITNIIRSTELLYDSLINIEKHIDTLVKKGNNPDNPVLKEFLELRQLNKIALYKTILGISVNEKNLYNQYFRRFIAAKDAYEYYNKVCTEVQINVSLNWHSSRFLINWYNANFVELVSSARISDGYEDIIKLIAPVNDIISSLELFYEELIVKYPKEDYVHSSIIKLIDELKRNDNNKNYYQIKIYQPKGE